MDSTLAKKLDISCLWFMIIVTNDVNLINSLIPSDNQRSRSKATDAKVLQNHKSIDASKNRFFNNNMFNVECLLRAKILTVDLSCLVTKPWDLNTALYKNNSKKTYNICKFALNIWKLVKLRLFGASRSWKTILLQYQVHENVICSKEVFVLQNNTRNITNTTKFEKAHLPFEPLPCKWCWFGWCIQDIPSGKRTREQKVSPEY